MEIKALKRKAITIATRNRYIPWDIIELNMCDMILLNGGTFINIFLNFNSIFIQFQMTRQNFAQTIYFKFQITRMGILCFVIHRRMDVRMTIRLKYFI